jgi:hypothetical protein
VNQVSETPERLSEKVSRLFEARAKRFKRASLFVKIVLVGIASAVVSAMQFLQIPEEGVLSAPQAIGLVASAIVLIGVLFVLITEEDSSEELATARTAVEEVRTANDLYEAITVYEDVNERALQLYQSMIAMRRIIEIAVVAGRSVAETVTSLMEVTERSLPIALGLQQSDQWTICVYKAEPNPETGRDELQCIAHNRAIRCGIGEARSWPEGVGVSGIAYVNNSEVIVPNMHSSGLGSVFNLGDRAKGYDQDRYRSLAAVPVQVDDRDKPWGVVIATNDRYDHFTLDDEEGPTTTEPVRALAGMVALAVAVCRGSAAPDGKSEGTPPPTGDAPIK